MGFFPSRWMINWMISSPSFQQLYPRVWLSKYLKIETGLEILFIVSQRWIEAWESPKTMIQMICSWTSDKSMGVHIPWNWSVFFLKKTHVILNGFFFGFESSRQNLWRFWRGSVPHLRRWAGKISNTIWVRLVGFPPRTRLGIFWWSYIGL